MWRSGIYNHDGPENVRSTIGWVSVFLLFGFISFNAFFPNNDVNIALDTVVSVLGLYVVVKYARQSFLAVLTGSGDSPDYLLVGITLSWLAQVARAVGSIISRLSGFDIIWVNSEYFGWVKMITIVAAVYHVVPAGAIQRKDGRESIPTPSRFGLVVALLISITLIVTLLAKKPNLKPYIDNMPGWSRDMFHTGQARSSTAPHA